MHNKSELCRCLENKITALKDLEKILLADNLYVEDCGIFIDVNKGFLVAAPTGVVGEDAIVSTHCPDIPQDVSFSLLANNDHSFLLEHIYASNKLRLRKDHNCYYKIQGQLHISNRWVRFGLLYYTLVRVCALSGSGRKISYLYDKMKIGRATTISLHVQCRRLNAVAYTLPRGVHMYAPAYTLCPVQGLVR